MSNVISHSTDPESFDPKDATILKRICISFTKLTTHEYIITHPAALKDVCPICQRGF